MYTPQSSYVKIKIQFQEYHNKVTSSSITPITFTKGDEVNKEIPVIIIQCTWTGGQPLGDCIVPPVPANRAFPQA